MKMFITENSDGKKCGACNWETSTFYGMGKTKKDARSNFKHYEDDEEYGMGLCALCMCDFLVEEKAEITKVR